MIDLLKDLSLSKVLRPFSKSPRITVLPVERGARRKARHRRNTKLLASYEQRKNSAIEHRMNTNDPEKERQVSYPTGEETIQAKSATSH